MDRNLVGLERAQEEFHQAFNNRMEDVEDEMVVCKNNINVFRIQMSTLEKDIKDVEMLVDNTQLRLEKVEDQVEGFVGLMSWLSQQSSVFQVNHQLLGEEIQRVQQESCANHESLLGKFAANNSIIDKKFIQSDEELERVVELVGQKVDRKLGEFCTDHMEAVEIEENWRKELEMKVAALEQRLEHMLTHTANLASLLLSVQSRVSEVEDVVMVVSEDDAKGEVLSSSSSDLDPVENMVVILVPGPSVVHTLVEIPEEFVPLILRLSSPHQSTPSPPYVWAAEEGPLHDGVPEYWADPEVGDD
jgi:hypothetical protein